MLRSTSVKQESWKPVKLLAKQPVKDKILSLECDLEGKIAVALTSTSINIFNDRELLNVVDIEGGYELKISSDLENIFVLSSKKLFCFDYWGNLKWEYISDGLIDGFELDPLGKNIVLRGEKFVVFLNRFGDLEWDYNFSEYIIDMYYTTSGAFLISTTNQIHSLSSENEFDKILEISGQVKTFFSDDGGISINDKNLISFSLTGHHIWQKDLTDVRRIRYSNNSLMNYYVEGDKKLVCQDRNGDELWTYSSEDDLQNFNIVNSGSFDDDSWPY